jgi:minor histocompatibility antigen H13
MVDSVVEGLSPSDAILFPILAGATLTGLYFVIKWMQDPKLLNKILNYYFSLIGVFGVGKLAADFLNVATTFVFPSVWSSRGQIFFVDPLLSQQVTGKAKPARIQLHREFTDKTNPFPGLFSTIKFPASINSKLWAIRALLKNHWIFRGYVHGVVNAKAKVQINDMIGFFIGIATIIAYNTSGKAWWLSMDNPFFVFPSTTLACVYPHVLTLFTLVLPPYIEITSSVHQPVVIRDG